MEAVPGTPTSPLNTGEWNMIYVSFVSLKKGQGYSKIVINGATDSTALNWSQLQGIIQVAQLRVIFELGMDLLES